MRAYSNLRIKVTYNKWIVRPEKNITDKYCDFSVRPVTETTYDCLSLNNVKVRVVYTKGYTVIMLKTAVSHSVLQFRAPLEVNPSEFLT